MEDLKLEILKAIENGNYEVSFEEPNNIIQCTKYDGTVFYKMRDDDAKFGCHPGYCHVDILDYTFTCDLGTGDWDGDEELIDDEDIINAIESIDGVIYGEHYDGYSYLEIYYAANPDAQDGELYGDGEGPVDIDDLGWNDVYIEVEYKTSDSDSAEIHELECTISDQKLYDLYVEFNDHKDFEKGFILTHNDIREFDEELFNVIMEQIVEDIEDGENHDDISFQINFSVDTVESQLG